MKILIVYRSYHRMNTQKVARAMAEATGATLATVDEVRPEDFDGYDLMGFGSGIYGGRHHKDLVALVEKMPSREGRRVFVFSTSGGANERSITALSGRPLPGRGVASWESSSAGASSASFGSSPPTGGTRTRRT